MLAYQDVIELCQRQIAGIETSRATRVNNLEGTQLWTAETGSISAFKFLIQWCKIQQSSA